MIRVNLWRVKTISIEKIVGKDDDTRLYVKKNCASGIIDPLLARPLWDYHTYMGSDNRVELHCPFHQEVYDKIKNKEREDAQKRLDELDGKA